MTGTGASTGGEALLRALLAAGVDTVLANPGTSEMHVVAAVDAVSELRSVLVLFEQVATGAADGYARMADRPAAALLHLGPGLANGWAGLHNARRGGVPVVTVVGEHATYHKRFDAPLESDVLALAQAVGWAARATNAADVAPLTQAAVRAAMGPPGGVATLVLPADVAWDPAPAVGAPSPASVGSRPVRDGALAAVAATLRCSDEPTVLLLGGPALREPALRAAARVAAASGARLLAEVFPTRLTRGAGIPAVERMGYLPEHARSQLTGVPQLVLVGARAPVAFFAYQGQPSSLVPDGCAVSELVAPEQASVESVTAALDQLADELGAPADVPTAEPAVAQPADGPLTVRSLADVVAALLPEGAIVVDEANTSGVFLPAATAGSPAHDWLTNTGGAIGHGLPMATGAALACPDRPVWCLQADGSAMYTLSALWTQAREGLDVTTVLLNNRSYAILGVELYRAVGEASGPRARDLLDLSRPELDFVSLARGMGVPAERATTAGELAGALRRAQAEPGPHLIDAVLTPLR